MLIRETFLNQTKGHTIGESDWYEPWTDDIGKLFLAMQREYGRCVSKMYIDRGSESVAVGWVFAKRMEYEDYRGRGDRYYVREVWVHLADRVETAREVVTDHVLN